jgi:hypothetical protein
MRSPNGSIHTTQTPPPLSFYNTFKYSFSVKNNLDVTVYSVFTICYVIGFVVNQGVTKRCRLSWLTDSALKGTQE